MSPGKLCFFTMLAAIVAFPAVRKPEVEIRQSNLGTANSPIIETPPAVFVSFPSRDPNDLGPGKLLVASRALGDPNFAQTVILLVHYDAGGVVGLVLNRRTGLPISQVFAALDAAKDRSDTVYLGGPLATPTVFALFRPTEKLEKAEHVFGGVYWISTKIDLEKAISSRPDPGVFHVYLGYAGWTPDQLRNEVRLGGVVHFSSGQRNRFQRKSGFLVASND